VTLVRSISGILEAKIHAETNDAVNQSLGQRIAQLRHSVAHGNPVGADSEVSFSKLFGVFLSALFGA
jgi:hypothetical protein